jgi:hypothetical protein
VVVVRCGDDNGVDVFLGLEHLAEIGVQFRLGKIFSVSRQRLLVHIAERDNILTRDAANIARAHSADSDRGDVEFLAWRRLARAAQDMPGTMVKAAAAMAPALIASRRLIG